LNSKTRLNLRRKRHRFLDSAEIRICVTRLFELQIVRDGQAKILRTRI